MSRREDIQTHEWTDELLPFSSEAKTLAIWSRTNGHCNMAGLYRIGEAAIRFETGLSPKRFKHAFDELQRAGYLRYDEPLLFVPSRAGRFSGVNPNMARSMAASLKQVAPHPFVVEFVQLYRNCKWFQDNAELAGYERDLETVGQPFGNGSKTHQDRDTDRDRDAA